MQILQKKLDSTKFSDKLMDEDRSAWRLSKSELGGRTRSWVLSKRKQTEDYNIYLPLLERFNPINHHERILTACLWRLERLTNGG